MVINRHLKRKENKSRMPSSSKSIEAETYKAVQAIPFTKMHGCPSRNNHETLKKEASDLTFELEDITYD
jgi:hypothetical protein